MSTESNCAPANLPCEISDAIIDNLHNDSQALAACGLVCRSWLPCSRYHLFANIVLRPEFTAAFIGLLCPTHSTVLRHIRRIEFDQIKHEPPFIVEVMAKEFDDVLLLGTRLAAVRVLCLKGLDWLNSEQATKSALVSTFKHIEVLETTRSHFGTSDEIIHLLSSFPLLERIELNRPKLMQSGPRCHIPVPSRLRAVQLLACNMIGLLYWLASYEDTIVDTLRLSNIGPEEFASVRDYFHVLGSSLHNLRLDFYTPVFDTRTTEDFCNCIDLSDNINLRVVRFDYICLDTDTPSTVYETCLPILLSRITSTHIEKVVFEISTTAIGDLDRLDWGHLANVLARPQFSRLQRVEFRVSCTNEDQVSKMIRSKLHALDAQGIIHCMQCSVTIPSRLHSLPIHD